MQADLCGIALALAPNEACYVPLAHKQSGGGAGLFDAGLAPDQVKHTDAIEALRPVLESSGILKIGFDVKFSAVMLAQHGITLRNIDDAQLISYVLDAGRGSHALEQLSERWFGLAMLKESELLGNGKGKITFDQVPIDKAAPLSAEGADVTLRVWRVLKPRLVAEHMATVYETLERPLVSVLARMERRGISIDRQVLSRLSGDFAQTAARVEAEIQQIAGEPVNVGSPKQIGDILFGKMGLPGGSKTKTGAWSTTAQVLDELAEQGHDFPKKILEWRQVSKLKSTYTDALPTYVNPQTHRVHTTYALAATTTGRLSSNEPNLQNIPVRTEDGRKIRRAFIATPGHKLVSADYSQIELRLLAEIADIPVLKQAFRDGLDIHAMTASEMFGVPIKGMPSEIRRRAKAINFGIIYGISAFGLAKPARHRPRRGVGLHQEVLRALPRHPRLYGRDPRFLPEPRLCHHAVRPQVPLSRHQGVERLGTRLQRARRDQRAASGHRGRHHPPRHDAGGGCTRREEALGADAAPGARRADLRGAGRRGRGDASRRAARHAGRAVSGCAALGAAARGCTRGEQLGRGALAIRTD
ncbi:DNA polymerase I-like protein with 3'-5' exonuclease and polymerase domains [Bradyrhizobium sp. LM2.7]